MHGVFLFLPGLYGYVMGYCRFLESPYTQLYSVFLTHRSKDRPIRNTYAKDQQNPSYNTSLNTGATGGPLMRASDIRILQGKTRRTKNLPVSIRSEELKLPSRNLRLQLV